MNDSYYAYVLQRVKDGKWLTGPTRSNHFTDDFKKARLMKSRYSSTIDSLTPQWSHNQAEDYKWVQVMVVLHLMPNES